MDKAIELYDISKEIFKEEEVEEAKENSITIGTSFTNVVTGDKLRKIQSRTLSELKDFLSKTFGPMGSNTKIITGNDKETITSSYSKDGLKVLKSISNSGVIEASIIEELIEITRHVEKEVGDGTTSTVILSSLIFDNLLQIQKTENLPPYELMRIFVSTVDKIKDSIRSKAAECDIDSIYHISMISTNGNEEVSSNIRDIYDEYGLDVDLSVGISNSSDSIIRSYDGLTITEGMSDPVFINNKETGTSEIHNAKVYHFADPIDTLEMTSFLDAIIEHNIYDPLRNDENCIPTVICCPRISKDTSATLKQLTTMLYQFEQSGLGSSAKPPILIVTNIVASDELIMDDISNLCGCKTIKKYIDRKIYDKDVESGEAPTIDTVFDFCGEAELVVSDSKKTKFINPKYMNNVDEDGHITEPSAIYTAMVNFLETEIKNAKPTDSAAEVGLLKKRLAALKANMVEYLVGGITVSERDAKKDLVEDAIKNCGSAARSGVGFAANFEGLLASEELLETIKNKDSIEFKVAAAIYKSYFDISKILYGSVVTEDKAQEYVVKSLQKRSPFNIKNLDLEEGFVLCTIDLDINILDTLSKIISMMVTCNQCLLQAPQLNKY